MGIVNKILIHLRATPLLAYFFLQIFDGLKIAENTAFTLASNIPPLVLLACAYQRSLFASILQNHLQNRSNDSKNQWEVAKVSPIQPSLWSSKPWRLFSDFSLRSSLPDPWFIRLQIRLIWNFASSPCKKRTISTALPYPLFVLKRFPMSPSLKSTPLKKLKIF